MTSKSVDEAAFESAIECFFSEIDELLPNPEKELSENNESNSHQQFSTLPLPPPPPPPPPPPQGQDCGNSVAENKADANEPITSWEMLFDEEEGHPYYWNCETNESVWEPPLEFIKYTEEYAAYHNALHKIDAPSVDGETSSERKVNRSNVEYLTEYIAYSSSGSSDSHSESSQSDRDSNNSNTTAATTANLSKKKKRKSSPSSNQTNENSVAHSKMPKIDISTSNEETCSATTQIQPLDEPPNGSELPAVSSPTSANVGSYSLVDYEDARLGGSDSEESRDSIRSHSKFIGPLMQSDAQTKNITNTSPNRETKEEISKDDQLKNLLCDRCQILLEKIQFFNTSKSSLRWQEILLIQLRTRLEDLQVGELSAEYFKSHLVLAEKRVEDHEECQVPVGWSCYWSSDQKQYYYESQITGDTQWEIPTDTLIPSSESEEISKSAAEKLRRLKCDPTVEEGEILDCKAPPGFLEIDRIKKRRRNHSEKSKTKKSKKKSKKRKSKKSNRLSTSDTNEGTEELKTTNEIVESSECTTDEIS